MTFHWESVPLEEYNQNLRDSVNAYYEHTLNDTSMSKEEAIQSTAEMSERYLTAVEEFQHQQDLQNSGDVQEAMNTTPSPGNPVSVDDVNINDEVDLSDNDVSYDSVDDGVDDGVDM